MHGVELVEQEENKEVGIGEVIAAETAGTVALFDLLVDTCKLRGKILLQNFFLPLFPATRIRL